MTKNKCTFCSEPLTENEYRSIFSKEERERLAHVLHKKGEGICPQCKDEIMVSFLIFSTVRIKED